ncbi:MAG: Rieske 2Fe-2S domain-containing protein, partial [Caulobacterales bacterium]
MADTKPLERELQRGFGSDERPVIKVLWERDATGQNSAMQSTGDYQPDNRYVDFKRYYDKDYFKQELENVWKKQWLFACCEEDIPNVGDRVPLEVGPLSYFIVRTGPDEFKAYYNSCLHRGTKLCAKKESSASIRCPYHAWEWHN